MRVRGVLRCLAEWYRGAMGDPRSRPGCLGFVARLLQQGSEPRGGDVAFRRAGALLTPAELDFYRVLTHQLGGRLTVCPKVRVGDLLKAISSDRSAGTSARNRINRSHVDFVLCDPQTMWPVAAVELDDSSHNAARQRERDAHQNAAFAAAGLPLVRLPVKRGYSGVALETALAEALGAIGGGPTD